MAEIEGEDDLRPRFITADTQTNITGSGNPVIVVNQDKKKKPYDVKFGKNEPKIKPNMKYSSKQSYRRYKSKTEPNLNSNIMVNEEDDIVKQIKKAFGITPENTNYSSVESAPIDPNYFNFQTPAEFAPIQNGHENDVFSKYTDDLLLYSFRYGYDLEANEKFEFDKIRREIGKEEDLSESEMIEKLNEALDKFIIDNKIENAFTKEQIPQLRKIGNLTLKEAKDYVDKNLSDEEQTALSMEMRDEMEKAGKYNKEDEIPTDDQLFITTIKEYQLSKLKEEMEFSNMTKAQEEALIGQKIPDEDKLLFYSDDDKEEELTEEPPSPVHTPTPTELSAKTTEPYGSSVGELTSAELKRPVGRPATKPETIAKKQYEQALKSFKITKKKNVGKTFDFNQPVKMEYNLEFYKSFNY